MRVRNEIRARMRPGRGVLLGVLLGFAPSFAPPASGAPPIRQDAATEIVLAALPTVRKTLPPGRAVLDPAPVCSAKLIGWNCPQQIRDVAESLGFVLHGRDFTYICLPSRRSCSLVGGSSLVSFARPVVTGDQATLEGRIWWRTGSRTEPVASRTMRLRLERRGKGWEVAEG